MATHEVRRIAAAFVVLTLVVTACNDDASDAPTSTSTTVAAPTTPAPAGSSRASVPAAKPALTLGFLAPGAGLLNTLVVGQQRGLQLAADDINAAGGVLGGPVALVTATESPDTALDATIDGLVGQGANVLVGPVGSETAANMLPILAARHLLTCSASATATSLTTSADTSVPPVFVRTALRDDYFAPVVADQLMTPTDETPAPKTVMILGRDDVYGTELSAGLSAELTVRGATVTPLGYPSRRVQFPDEAAAVMATNPDRVVLISYEEGPRLIADLVNAGFPAERIVGLDGLLAPRLADEAFSSEPTRADGVSVIGTTGDRAIVKRLSDVSAPQDQLVYGPQMYDCAITLALAALAAGSTDPVAIAAQIARVTAGGRPCSTFAHCGQLLAAGEDIDYEGTTGRLAFDAAGDVSTARVSTLRVSGGQLTPVSSQDVDLIAEQRDAVFASAVQVAQLQQALKALGYLEGEVTGVYDDATTAAVAALQRDLGLPDTGQYDAATDAALRARVGARLTTFGTGVAELQQALADRGYYTGPIDGVYSAETIAAVQAFQTDLGVPATGIVDVATMQAIYARGITTGVASVPTTTVPPPTTAPKPTVPPKPTSPPPTAGPAPTTTQKPSTTPPTTPTTEAPAKPAPPPKPAPPAGPDLYAALAADARFSTFVEIVNTGGYRADLSGPGPLTVFAPSNDAFAAFDADQLHELRTSEGAADALLRGLIVEGVVDMTTSASLPTIGGVAVPLDVAAGSVTFGGAAVVGAPLDASNGVVHGLAAVPDLG
jgi:branched-chain amino acid transport system substrate-binding protein